MSCPSKRLENRRSTVCQMKGIPMPDCLFCKIISGEIPGDFIYEDDEIVAFRDLNPAAPFHALIVPRRHIATINDASEENAALLGRMFVAAADIAREQGFDQSGYRLITNCNKDGGQVVFHIHMHILAGKRMGRLIA